MLRIATFALAVLGAFAVAPSRSAEPPAAAGSAAPFACADSKPSRPASTRPATGSPPAEVHVSVVCEAPQLASAPSAAPSGGASTSKPPVPAQPASAPLHAEPGTSAPAPGSAVSVVDGLKLIAALAALALLVVGQRVLLHALDVRLFALARDPGRYGPGGYDASAPTTQGFTFRRHWGSFGGESTGWNMSARLARLLSGALLVAAALAMLMLLIPVEEGSGKRTAAPAGGSERPEKAPK